MKNYFSFLLIFLFSPNVFSQSGASIEVRGKVVEVSNGKSVGLPDITVRIKGYGWAVTDKEGSFSITLPSDKEYVLFELEGCPYPVISPYKSLVNIPPHGKLDIKVCAAENKKLRDKVEELNNTVNSLERQRTLSKRQLAAMHQTLLDTILHFESRIATLEIDLEKKGAVLAEKNNQILLLENEVAGLERQLADALAEKYAQQKEVFDKISAALIQYIDQTKNLRDNMRPVQITSYFSTSAARERLYESIEKYNAARREILDNHISHVTNVSHYWEAFQLAQELEETYDYLLKNVHGQGVYPLEFVVNDYLKQALTNQISSSKAKKAAEEGANEAIPKLNPMIDVLEKKATDLIFKLKNNL